MSLKNFTQLTFLSQSSDWSAGAQTGINYLTARNRVPSVGAFLAAYLDWLHLNNLVDYSQTTMVGFSLGGENTFHPPPNPSNQFLCFSQHTLLEWLESKPNVEKSAQLLDSILCVNSSTTNIFASDSCHVSSKTEPHNI